MPVWPYYQLGARRRAAGRGSDGCRGLTGAGTSERAARTTGPAREGWRSPAGTARSAGEAGLPRPVPWRAPRATRTAGSEGAVVIAVALVVVPEDYGAGKEYDRQDEYDPGDNHHPRCGRVEPGGLGPRRRRERRSCGDGSRRGRGFGCFAHALRILPRPITAITRSGNKLAVNPDAAVRCRFPKRSPALSGAPGYWLWVIGPPGSSSHPVSTFLRRGCVGRQDRRRDLTGSRGAGGHGRRSTRRDCPGSTTWTTRTTVARMPHHRVLHVVTVVEAAVTRMLPEDIAGEEDDRDDEHDPGDDRDPGRELEDPGGPVYHLGWRRRRRCCGSSPHCWGFRCFTHETHDAWVNNSCGYALLK